MSLSEALPRVHATVYPSGDLELHFKGCKSMMRKGGGKRGAIKALSSQSAKRCLTVFRALSDKLKVMITLTYPQEYLGLIDGPDSKKHLDLFLQWLRRETSPELVYAWVLEFQRSGNPHYHLLVSHEVDCRKVAQRWFEIVGSGLEKHRDAGTRVEGIYHQAGAADYVGRYLGKVQQKEVPEKFERVGRFWGYRRGSIEKLEAGWEYPTREEAKKDTRVLRRARKAALRGIILEKKKPIMGGMAIKRVPIKWKWKQNGFTDRTLGLGPVLRLLGTFRGEVVQE